MKLAEIGVHPHRDDINKRAFIVWHQLPDELVIKAESFYRDDWWESPNQLAREIADASSGWVGTSAK